MTGNNTHITHSIPELVAPAGTPAKLRTALHFGADAVYLGLKQYSLRARSGNFDHDQLRWALGHAHERGRRIYVAVNIQPFDDDMEGIEQTLELLGNHLRPDGIIVADPGVLALARRLAPAVPLHLSTQASVSNSAAARFWFAQGIRRIVMARELSLEQLAGVAAEAGGELEAFIHGAVCIAWSGRCLLSLYWAGRDPRRGHCAQGCRWPYLAIEDRRRPGLANPVEQDHRGTYFFDAKDTCALPLLPRLMASGVRAFKIEGRTRSPYYLGITVDVYRQAMDCIAAGEMDRFHQRLQHHVDELARASTRGFSTHFLGGEADLAESYNPQGSYHNEARHEYVGQVLERRQGALVLDVRNPVEAGEALELRDRGLVCEPVCAPAAASSKTTLLLPGTFEAGPGALVRRAHTGTVCASGK